MTELSAVVRPYGTESITKKTSRLINIY